MVSLTWKKRALCVERENKGVYSECVCLEIRIFSTMTRFSYKVRTYRGIARVNLKMAARRPLMERALLTVGIYEKSPRKKKATVGIWSV